MNENFNIVLVGTGGQGVILSSNILGWAALKTSQKNKVRTAETHGMAQRGGTVIVHLRFGPTVESPMVKKKSADSILSFELVEAVRYSDFLKPDGILLVNDEVILPPVMFRGQHASINRDFCIGCGNCRTNCLINTYYRDPKSLAVINSPASRITNGVCEILSGCTGCSACIEICCRNAIQIEKEITYPCYLEIENKLKAISKNSFIIPASRTAMEMGEIRMTNVIMIGALLEFKDVPLEPSAIKEAMKQLLGPKIIDPNLKALEAGQGLMKKILKK